ncbi:peptidase S9 [Erythrobacter sp. QSSC1-22B]|uniref:dipeptidyl-peptidase 5 n=1 Tax=Erythrobacter sp. QSSC1-22B TaxID=1860125 RepID=UPI00080573B8|nr:S9 family peptidase [Erythrobacter sp. QSSC1-22B]OBX20015.1 peptidase S9 [Erythrobacter sp. QSSC1-22B]
MNKRFGLATLAAGAASLSLATPLAAQVQPAPQGQEQGQDQRPAMTAADLVTMPRLGAPSVSKDGNLAVYPVTRTDPESFARNSEFYLHSLAVPGAAPVPLDLGGPANSAMFGADGWLYFLSGRPVSEGGEERSRLWRIQLGPQGIVGTPMLAADLPSGIEGFALAPENAAVAVWAEIARDCPTFGCEGDGTAHLTGPGDGLLYEGDAGFIRHWDSWETPGTFSRVFVFAMEDGRAAGEGRALDGAVGAGGPTGDTPTKPFGGGEDVAWAPDGSGIYFVARETGASEPTSTNLDIWWYDLSGAAPTNLTLSNEASDALPTPSPDGKYLAYLAMARPGYESDRMVVQLRDLATGQTRALTPDFDRSFSTLAWTPDSRFIVATAQDVLDTPAFRIDPRDGSVERLDLMAGHEAHIGNATPLAGDRLLFTRDSIGAPPELYLSSGWEQAEPLTDVASTRVGQLASIVTERFSFAGAEGTTVWGQITKPENTQGLLPAILYVHGGPQGSFNDGWSTRWNPRVLASQGYAVISVDFHGSTGYGQAFTDAINRDWGGKPLEDLQKGLAAALALDSQIDGTRACAMGASYGGYMMNWIAGQWPDRFDCLVQHDGLFDMRSFYYATEELWFPRWDFGGSYQEQTETYERWNPVNFVDRWQTPMLVITGQKDFRVPYTQGIQSFTALQERGIPSQLLVFPGENHWVLAAKNSLQWHDTVFAWLDRWLKPDGE